ncbi:MAG: MFS transporter, partial [Chloroflexota bacterium]
ILLSTQGIGAIAGGLSASFIMRRIGDGKIVGAGLLLFGAASLLLTTGTLPLVVTGIVIAGAGLPWVIVGFGTALQRRTPPELQGRVYSAADTMVSVPQTISIALGAALSTIVDYRILIAVMSAVLVITAAYLLSRRFTDPEESSDAAEPIHIDSLVSPLESA